MGRLRDKPHQESTVPAMVALSDVFNVLTEKVDTPRSRLEKVASLPLADQPHFMVYLEVPNPHIRVLCGFQFVTPSYVSATPKDGKVLAFSGDLRGDQLPTTVEILPDWIKNKDTIAPTVAVIDRALDALPPGIPRFNDVTPA